MSGKLKYSKPVLHAVKMKKRLACGSGSGNTIAFMTCGVGTNTDELNCGDGGCALLTVNPACVDGGAAAEFWMTASLGCGVGAGVGSTVGCFAGLGN